MRDVRVYHSGKSYRGSCTILTVHTSKLGRWYTPRNDQVRCVGFDSEGNQESWELELYVHYL